MQFDFLSPWSFSVFFKLDVGFNLPCLLMSSVPIAMAAEGETTTLAKLLQLIFLSTFWGMQIWVTFISGRCLSSLLHQFLLRIVTCFRQSPNNGQSFAGISQQYCGRPSQEGLQQFKKAACPSQGRFKNEFQNQGVTDQTTIYCSWRTIHEDSLISCFFKKYCNHSAEGISTVLLGKDFQDLDQCQKNSNISEQGE